MRRGSGAALGGPIATLSSHCSGEVSPSSTRRRPSVTGASMPWRSNASPSSGTVASDSAVWSIEASTCPAGTPAPTSSPARRLRLPSAIAVATRSPAPARPAKVSLRPPLASASSWTSEKMRPAAAPARFGAARGRPRRRPERGGVLGAGGELGARHVVGGLDVQAARFQHVAQLAAQVRVACSRARQRRPARSPRARARDPRAWPPRAHARARRRRRSACVPSGGTRPLEATSTARAVAHARPTRRRPRAGSRRERRAPRGPRPRKLDLGHGLDVDASGRA